MLLCGLITDFVMYWFLVNLHYIWFAISVAIVGVDNMVMMTTIS